LADADSSVPGFPGELYDYFNAANDYPSKALSAFIGGTLQNMVVPVFLFLSGEDKNL